MNRLTDSILNVSNAYQNTNIPVGTRNDLEFALYSN